LDLASKGDLTVRLAPGVILSGMVTDEQGKVVPGTKMSLYIWPDRNGGYSVRVDPSSADGNGHYEIRAVPPDYRYTLHATAQGYNEDSIDVRTDAAAKSRMECETLILRLANLDVSGTVVDGNDKPIPNANVYAGGRGQPRQQVRTDAQGRFTVHGLCSREVHIDAVVDGPTRLSADVRTTGGATGVKVRVFPQYLAPAKPPALRGKALPPVAEFGIRPPDLFQDQRVLLCFFDAGQRPSRSTVATLAKRLDGLRQKGVMVIAIRGGTADNEELRQWLQEQSALMPLGSVQGDAAKATFAWGVQGWPWLIVTDKNHIVTAEGFGIEDLDSKIQ
jgi:protocatechuate 3,4-dioxygenase beta subunit